MSFFTKKQLEERALMKKNPSPFEWSGNDHLDAALKASNCTDVNEMLKKFHETMIGKSGPIPRLPAKEMGYHKPVSGCVPEIDIQQEEYGLWCQEEGHQGQVSNVDMYDDVCKPCKEFGAPMKSVVGTWCCPALNTIQSTSNAFLVVLTTRSSNGRAIPQSFFQKLAESVNNNSQKIKQFLRQQTGLDFEIHIIEESAANGSILATEESMLHHDRSGEGEEELHLPLGYVASILKYHYATNWKVGYMMNCPGDYNGKISNYISNLKNFEIAGIDPASVIFMTYGLDVAKGSEFLFAGVPENFTIFTGKQMLDRIEECRLDEACRIPKSSEATVDGFLTAASDHGATRKTRNIKGRKQQSASKKKP